MALKKYNPASQRQSERTYLEMVEKNENVILKISKLLSQGYSKPQITGMLKKDCNITSKDASKYIDAVSVVAFELNPQFATEIVQQARLAINLTIRQAEMMFEVAQDSKEQASALLIKLKALAQLRDLAPKQIQMQSIQMEEAETRRILFDSHGIEINEDTTIDVEFE
jgi:hypothetical protein